jgi:cellulose synthase/poly-beta-1,6-N-acetylglucosamine synthase-like glycosyltransferase
MLPIDFPGIQLLSSITGLANSQTLKEITSAILTNADMLILVYFLALNSFYALLLFLSIPEIWAHWHLADDDYFQQLLGSDALPPISILVPAYNEEKTIVSSVLSFLTLEYPRHEVVLVNDGSKDGTMAELIREYDLYQVPPAVTVHIPTKTVHAYYRSRRHSKLLCIDKSNGGKADSLNAAMNAARYPYVLAVDADTLIDRDALMRLARPFLIGHEVAAVGGTVRVANACRVEHGRVVEARVDRRWLPGIQTVEYLRAFLFGRLGWNRLGGNLIISGAFGLFKREYMAAIGGYVTDSVTEDMDLVVRLHRYLRENKKKDSVMFIPDPVAWTEVPSVGVLNRQRERWHRGLIATMWQHKRMLFNPKFGRVGMISMPFFVFGEMLAPGIELLGYLGFGLGLAFDMVDVSLALMFIFASLIYGLLLSVWAVVLEELTFRKYPRTGDVYMLLLFAVLETFGYRQLTVWFRFKAFWKFFRRDRSWGEMTREGFKRPVPQEA